MQRFRDYFQGSGVREQGSGVRGQRAGIRDQGSESRGHGSGVRKDGGVRFVVSHPFTKYVKGWATQCLSLGQACATLRGERVIGRCSHDEISITWVRRYWLNLLTPTHPR